MPRMFWIIPVESGGHPDQGLPGGSGGHPDQGLPGHQPHPDQGLPSIPGLPSNELPEGQPIPGNELPPIPVPPQYSESLVVGVKQPNSTEWTFTAYDTSLTPGHELPEHAAPKRRR
jgi:hypothetical protein